MTEINIERKAPLKNEKELVEKLERKYSEHFKKSLPCKISEIAKFARRRVNPKVNPAIDEETRKKMINDKEHGGTKLTDEEYLDTFIRIVYAFTQGCRQKGIEEEKYAHIVTAQTGAGKTNLTTLICKTIEKPVIIDPDKYKAYRPDIDQIDKTKFGMLTGIDSYDHRDNLSSFAIEHGYDLLYEVAPIEDGKLIGVDIEALNEKGYISSLYVLAVGDLVSSVGIHKRYEEKLESERKNPKENKSAKLTNLNKHDESVKAIKGLVHQNKNHINMNIYIRGNKENGYIPILIEKEKEVYKYLNNEEIYNREIRKSNKEYILTGNFERDINQVRIKMRERGADKNQIEQLEEILQRKEKEIER